MLFFLSDFTTISNVHRFPFAQWIRIRITRLPIIILARWKKKCNLEPVFTLIGRSVDTIVNEDRTNHRVFSVSIVINAQETRGGPLRALGPRWNFLIERSKESLIRRRKRNRIDDRVTKRLRWQDSIGFFLYRNDLAWPRRDTCGSIA